MKNKSFYCAMFLIIVVGLYNPISYSQAGLPTSFTVTIADDSLTAPNVYEFNIYVLNTSTTPFQLYTFQAKFNFNPAALNGAYAASWVPGSNDGILVASNQVNTVSTAAGYTRVIAKIASGYGNGAIISTVAPGTKFGRYRITATNPFTGQPAGVDWLYTTPFASAIFAYANDGLNYNVTATGTWGKADWQNPTLPVELTSFVSNVRERDVRLNWETKTEVNFNKFEIERTLVSTKDATVTWASVGLVQASGTSNSPKKYSYEEKNLQAGKYQYRLKMIDNDGSYKYSSIVETEVALPKNFELSQNYPNPFNPSTRINYSLPFDSRVTLEVYNIAGEKMGQIVNEEQSAGYYTTNFSSSTLNRSIASGVYIYKLNAVDKSTGNVFTSIKKMMLLK